MASPAASSSPEPATATAPASAAVPSVAPPDTGTRTSAGEPSRAKKKPGRRSAAARLARYSQRRQRLQARPRVVERHYRQTIRRVDLWSVLKLSICFYLTAMLVALGAGVVLWWIATQLGVIEGVEEFMGELLSSEDFRFLSWRILRGATLIGLVLVCLMTVLTVLAAAFYNVFAEIVGGVEVTVSEEENESP